MYGVDPEWRIYTKLLKSVLPLWLLVFAYSARLYTNPWMSDADRFLHIVKGCFVGTIAALIASYLFGRLEYSRVMMLLVFPISILLVTAGQAFVLWVDGWMSHYFGNSIEAHDAGATPNGKQGAEFLRYWRKKGQAKKP